MVMMNPPKTKVRDVEQAEKEVEDLSEETDLAIQSFHEIMNKIHLQGGINRRPFSFVTNWTLVCLCKMLACTITAPSSLNLQDAKENVFLSVIKKVTHFVMRSLQYALLDFVLSGFEC